MSHAPYDSHRLLGPSVLDRRTALEVLDGGPRPQQMPRLNYHYDRDNDIITIEGVRYSGEMFRQAGFGAPLNAPLKIAAREDGVLTLLIMEPGDPDWLTPKDEHGRVNVAWRFPDGGTVGVYVQPDAPQEAVAAMLRSLADIIEQRPKAIDAGGCAPAVLATDGPEA